MQRMANPKQSKGRRVVKAKKPPAPPPVPPVPRLTPSDSSSDVEDSTPILFFLGKTNGGNQSKATPFRPTAEVTDEGSSITFQSITRMPEYQDLSFEELRWNELSNAPKPKELPPTTFKPAHTYIASLASSDSHHATNGSSKSIFTFGQNSSIPPTDFDYYREQHIRPLMDLNDCVNALTYQETSINSTRIVVAGDQSHGKTSLLEALCGVDLPRGDGIQTRVPLILQLRQAQEDEDEYALIQVVKENVLGGNTKCEERIALGHIGNKVREYTAIVAGEGKNIVDVPIELKIFRKNQDDLTLIDLPGITRVATDDQAGGNGRLLEEQIMRMCRNYMKPKESILLNVVSAMVDFSTSASLQLSHELDTERKRTMLCITKVDQHNETGLHDKITKSIHQMNLKPQHVFAVRNRTQQENDKQMPLDEVRRLENEKLEQLTQGQVTEYQLGVKALSKHLVKIQCEEILKTLPRTRSTIKKVAADLKEELDGLGKPVGDAAACKARAVQLIDACANRLEGEATGRVHTQLDPNGSCEGEAFELTLVVEDFQAAYKREEAVFSPSVEAGGFAFKLEMVIEKDEKKSIALYLRASLMKESNLIDVGVTVSCSFVATSSGHEELERREMEHTYKLNKSKASTEGTGYSNFVSVAEAATLAGEVTFSAHVYIDSIEDEEASEEPPSLSSTLLCARLADLQDEFTTNINTLYSNSYFFSQGFRKSLARELQGSRGGIGLPGNIASHVPVGVLKKIRSKLPTPIAEYRNKVLVECTTTSQAVIESFVGIEQHPKLQSVLVDGVNEIFTHQAVDLECYHAKILEWEENICSSNHYFMDTVNSIRSSIDESDDDDKPLYLRHLTPSSIAAMSNEDQKLVDQQIEIFAYWKLMKKRLIDYVLLSTQGELVNVPIRDKLKTTMLDVVFRRDDEELVELLSRDVQIEKKRANVASRLEKLMKALKQIDEYKAKHPGGLVEILD